MLMLIEVGLICVGLLSFGWCWSDGCGVVCCCLRCGVFCVDYCCVACVVSFGVCCVVCLFRVVCCVVLIDLI